MSRHRGHLVFPPAPEPPHPEPSRARHPDRQGHLDRDGVRISYEVYGEGGAPTILLLPGWPLPGRVWTSQIPWLALRHRVVAFDPRGTGGSSRPRGAGAYALDEHVADALAVMDATGTEAVVAVAASRGAQTALMLAAEHPERVLGLAAIGPDVPLTRWPPRDALWRMFEEPRSWRRSATALAAAARSAPIALRSPSMRLFARRLGPLEAAAMFNRRRITTDFEGFLEWLLTKVLIPDRHSTRQVERVAEWYRETGAGTAADAWMGSSVQDAVAARRLCARVRTRVLVIQGEEDLATPGEWAAELARVTGGRLMVIAGSGHAPSARYPVVVNIALRDFAESVAGSGREPPGAALEAALHGTRGGA